MQALYLFKLFCFIFAAISTFNLYTELTLSHKGMAQVAKDAALGRESLYKALTPGAKPRFETVMKVARALGVRFTAQPA